MSVTSNGIQALNFIGRLDQKEEMLILNQGQQQAARAAAEVVARTRLACFSARVR